MSKKNLARGEGNRVADGAKVFAAADDSHVKQSSPIQLKAKELRNDPRYRTKMQPGTEREKSTTRKRMNQQTKPI